MNTGMQLTILFSDYWPYLIDLSLIILDKSLMALT